MLNDEEGFTDEDAFVIQDSESAKVSNSVLLPRPASFNYVDIKSTGCDGWLNLFFGDECIALVRDVKIADKMRNVIEPKYSKPCPDCGAVFPVGYEKGHQCSE